MSQWPVICLVHLRWSDDRSKEALVYLIRDMWWATYIHTVTHVVEHMVHVECSMFHGPHAICNKNLQQNAVQCSEWWWWLSKQHIVSHRADACYSQVDEIISSNGSNTRPFRLSLSLSHSLPPLLLFPTFDVWERKRKMKNEQNIKCGQK